MYVCLCVGPGLALPSLAPSLSSRKNKDILISSLTLVYNTIVFISSSVRDSLEGSDLELDHFDRVTRLSSRRGKGDAKARCHNQENAYFEIKRRGEEERPSTTRRFFFFCF